MSASSPDIRLWSRVDKSGECWLWTGTCSPKGYGYIGVNYKKLLVHRFAWELLVGPIPDGMEIDHRPTCPKCCVNPDHLRVVTHKQNQENRRGAMRNSKSGVRGVSWDKAKSLWNAEVQHDGKKWQKYFHTLADAEAAVIAKRLELFTHNDLDRSTS